MANLHTDKYYQPLRGHFYLGLKVVKCNKELTAIKVNEYGD